jgi:hypothetical protein
MSLQPYFTFEPRLLKKNKKKIENCTLPSHLSFITVFCFQYGLDLASNISFHETSVM